MADGMSDDIEQIRERLGAIEDELRANSEATRQVLEIFQAVRGGIKVLGWLGTAARWITGMAVFAGVCYGAWLKATGGSKP